MQTKLRLEEQGARITRAASLQTYATVRFLVDRDRVADAYQAYAYFRWVDDWLDEPTRAKSDRLEFVRRQIALLDACHRRQHVAPEAEQESMLISLVDKDRETHSGLQIYIRCMMAVMAFDAERRDRLISALELDHYTRDLSAAVTEALHYFIGHNAASPHGAARYLAAEGAHIAHMLRDAVEDNELGYFNVPREYLHAHAISPLDTESAAYCAWVRSRVQLARSYFRTGRAYLSRVQNLRCRLAGYAYVARFETVLDSIEREGYRLRRQYSDSKGARAGVQMGWSVLWSSLNMAGPAVGSSRLEIR